MEPISAARGHFIVSTTETGFVTGEIPIVAPVSPLDFDAFYGPARTSVAGALIATLGDRDLAIDAVDEALARAYQRWDRVGCLDNPAGWVYRVGLNHARNVVRRRRRRPPHDEIVVEFAIADPEIDLALRSLSIEHRAVVVCRYLLGWSERQTADALGVRPGTVKSRLSRALARLERRLDHLRPEGQR